MVPILYRATLGFASKQKYKFPLEGGNGNYFFLFAADCKGSKCRFFQSQPWIKSIIKLKQMERNFTYITKKDRNHLQ